MGLGVEIKYGTTQHTKILKELKNRFDFSYRKMSERHKKWQETDELFQAYVKETDEDSKRRTKREGGVPQYTTINVPYSYAMLLAAHTYWSSVFLARSPVMQYTGRHGEAQQKVQAVEAVLDYQVSVGGHLVPYYIWLLDAGKYGFGVLGNYWADEKEMVVRIEEQPETWMGLPIPGKMKKVRVRETVRGYQGNRVYNVRPYEFYPDPRVSLVNLQKGEFCGRITHLGWNEVLRRKEDGTYFNIDDLERLKNNGSIRYIAGSPILNLPLVDSEVELNQTPFGKKGFTEILEMTIELVPKEWELGPSSYPEKWVFTLAGDSVVIGCEPLGMLHNKFPFFVQSYEVDGYSHHGRGMIEIAKPMNDVMTWLVNSHFYNVRKALNDMIVVDPTRINMKDLTDGGPGRIIRLKQSAAGQDVRSIVSQLAVVDITSGHLKDANVVAEIIQRVTGVNDNIMGLVNTGGRKTATEVRTSSSFGINRLKTFSEYNSALGWSPLSQVLLQNTQQEFDMERLFRVAGDLLQPNTNFVNVTPELISGFYDFVPVDGTLPIDRFAQANLWKEILLGLERMPAIAMQYDVAGIFSWMAQLAGLKNISQFKIELTPDQKLMAAVQQGNLVPMNKALPQGNSNAGTATGPGSPIQ